MQGGRGQGARPHPGKREAMSKFRGFVVRLGADDMECRVERDGCLRRCASDQTNAPGRDGDPRMW